MASCWIKVRLLEHLYQGMLWHRFLPFSLVAKKGSIKRVFISWVAVLFCDALCATVESAVTARDHEKIKVMHPSCGWKNFRVFFSRDMGFWGVQ